MMQILIREILAGDPGPGFFSREKFPGNIGEALAFSLADAVRVLGVEADFSVFVDDLWVKGEDHVLFQWHVAFGADRRMFDHGRTDAMSGEMAERKSVLCERVSDTAVHIAGQFSRT